MFALWIIFWYINAIEGINDVIHSWYQYNYDGLLRYNSFAGYDVINDKIYLIGGILITNKYDNEIPIISFDIKSNNITKYKSVIMNEIINDKYPVFYSLTQGYTVLNNVIYMLLYGSGLICSLNMTDLSLSVHDYKSKLYLGNSNVYNFVGNESGLMMASVCSDNKRFIAVIGGTQTINDNDKDTRKRGVIFDFVEEKWIALKNLKKPRIGHACWVYNSTYIYVFGGSIKTPSTNDAWFQSSIDSTSIVREISNNNNNDNIGDKSIEKLIYNDNITNIGEIKWRIISNEMCVGRRGHRVTQILKDDKIYIIGGHYGGKIVEVLLPDMDDLMLTSSAFNQPERISHTVISSKDQIFMFGLCLLYF